MRKTILTICLIAFALSAYANNVENDINQLLNSKSAVKQQHADINTNAQTKNDFNSINKHYAFVLFYRASCPHCQRFVPIVKQLSDTYGFHVYPYSVQGQSLPSFPNSMTISNQIASTFFSSPNYVVPSLFLINTQTMKAFLINQGEESLIDLYKQVQQLEKIIKSDGVGNEI